MAKYIELGSETNVNSGATLDQKTPKVDETNENP